MVASTSVNASEGGAASVKVTVQDKQEVAAGVLGEQDEGLEEEFSVSVGQCLLIPMVVLGMLVSRKMLLVSRNTL